MSKKNKILMVAMMVLLAGACSNKKVDESHVGVRYNDGFLEGKSFEKTVDPGGSEWVYNDHVYELPTRQITWQTGDCDGCDAASLLITTKDKVQLIIDVAIRGTLNTSDGKLETFFNDICNKSRTRGDETVTGCWENADEEGQLGWDLMLIETFGNPQTAVANDIGATFVSADLRYNPETKDSFAKTFGKEFSSAQQRLVGDGGYFCQPGFKRNKDKCKELTVEVTRVIYSDPDLETVQTKMQLAIEQEKLAAQELNTALAQQATNRAKATTQNLALMEKEAMMACANRDGCTMSFIVGGEPEVSVPVG
jgi:hypothetical protein